MLKIATIFGTRPEILKLSSLIPLLDKEFNHILVHTNQHYSYNMDRVFFKELNLRNPDYNLNVGSGTQAEQTAKMMMGIEKVLLKEKPDVIIVYSDPNTPLAGALAASKLNIPLVHLEAGTRSFNRKMPEEINRIVADHCADLLVVPDNVSYNNLIKEGIPKEKIYLVSDPIINVALRARELGKNCTILSDLKLKKDKYVLVTIHRAENTNDLRILKGILDSINEVSKSIMIVFPMHPRTQKIIRENKIKISKNIRVIEPQGYLNFIKLIDNSLFVMTDSGGVQKESAALNVPCLVVRTETEWTYLTDAGKTILVGIGTNNIASKAKDLLVNRFKIAEIKNIKVDLGGNFEKAVIKILKQKFGKRR